MPARSIGTGTLSFGMVSIPIRMYSAGESASAVSFNLLHSKCKSRLKQQYVCPKDGEKVEKDDMVKGYEFSKGQYVIFSPDELKTLEEKATNSIDINEFVQGSQVDRMYLEKVYYLGPDKGGERAYRLLTAAMKKTGRVAIGQYAARGKQYLVMVRPLDNVLVMEQLHYADELRAPSEVPVPEGDVKEAELDLAVQLLEQAASAKFEPEKYSDQVRKRVLEQIQRKVEGHEITEEPAEEPKTQIIDLMDALKASLAKGGRPGAAKKDEKDVPAVPKRKVAGR